MVTSAFGGSQNKASLPAGRRAGERAQGAQPRGQGVQAGPAACSRGVFSFPRGQERGSGQSHPATSLGWCRKG